MIQIPFKAERSKNFHDFSRLFKSTRSLGNLKFKNISLLQNDWKKPKTLDETLRTLQLTPFSSFHPVILHTLIH